MGLRASKLSKLIGAQVLRKRLRGSSLTPRGYIPMCVGMNNDTRRFMVRAKVLEDADFLEFLYRSAEEYGFCNEGVLRIPYEAKDFEEWMLRRSKRNVFRVKPIQLWDTQYFVLRK